MIRPFQRIDVRRLRANKFSIASDSGFIFDDDTFYKHTLVTDKSDVLAIICFKNYWGNNWIACFFISDEMPAIYAKQLKRFVDDAIIDLGAERVQTDSQDCPELNRWHKFMEFTLEGKREKMLYDKDYNLWGKLKGRDF